MKNLRLKAARAVLDMSQQDLADAVGVSRQTINAIEKGDYNPTIKLCIAICRILGKTLDELFWEEEAFTEGGAHLHRPPKGLNPFIRSICLFLFYHSFHIWCTDSKSHW